MQHMACILLTLDAVQYYSLREMNSTPQLKKYGFVSFLLSSPIQQKGWVWPWCVCFAGVG